ncbi:MAG TPA: DUF4956 domain-containing protein [Candidatus Methanofastidiosa archaeon]|nr:DUF4956 domain-containing protein [Candidatus Methanofastidiosa archaeon]
MDLNGLLDTILNSATTSQELNVQRVVVSLLVTFLISLFIFYIYRETFRGVLYTRNFNVGLVLTALVTSMIIIPISTNIALSLGMVGALSIVRFRAAIKDPMDIIFTFWAIAIGITCGAALYMVAIVATAIIGTIVYVMCQWDVKGAEPYLLVTHYAKEAEDSVQGALPTHKLRSRTMTPETVELMVEVRMKKDDTCNLDSIMNIVGVKDVALVSYNGDYVS